MSRRDYQRQRPHVPAERASQEQAQDSLARIDAGAGSARSVAQVPRSPIRLQSSLGNRQVQRLLQRETEPEGPAAAEQQDEAEDLGLSAEEAELADTILTELSEADIDTALAGLAADAEASAETAEEGLVQVSRDPRMIQRGKKKSVVGIASAASPNHALATLLENNNKPKPRLLKMSAWRKMRKRHIGKNIRKYVAIRHQNLQHNVVNEDLVLLIALRRRTKLGTRRDIHYAAIEAKSNQKRQTAQNRTELLGEAMATIRMEAFAGGDCKLIIGYASGAGIDQLWKSPSKQTYYVVEAKGPGAKLKVDVFAVRGAANGAALTQMSQAWIEDRIPRLRTSHATAVTQLLKDCGLKIVGGKLVDDPAKHGAYTLEGLVITANWDDTSAELGTGISKRAYTF